MRGFQFLLLVSAFTLWATGNAVSENLAPGTVFVDCEGCPEMVVIPQGSITIGSTNESRPEEGPPTRVDIARPFALARFETTFEQYALCVEDGFCPELPFDRRWGRGDRPVIYVDWNEAVLFAQWLARKTGQPYRLPSEAEWEYAALAGSEETQHEIQGNSNCYRCWDGWAHRTEPVGSFRANGFGLFDMLGNVTEWTADCWTPHHGGVPQIENGSCALRVRKGGSWYFGPSVATPSYRFGARPIHKGYDIGFRVALDLP